MSDFNLPVPFFSQRDVNYKWQYRYEETNEALNQKKGDVVPNIDAIKIDDGCCNITCLAMVLNYLGLTTDTPEIMAGKVFSDGKGENFNRFLKWASDAGYKKQNNNSKAAYRCIESPLILKNIATDIYHVRNAFYADNSYTLTDVLDEVKAGYPVIVNCGIVRPSANYVNYREDKHKKEMEEYTDKNSKEYKSAKDSHDTYVNYQSQIEKDANWEYHGHYIVITGVTEKGDIIVNDPWGKSTNDSGILPQETLEGQPEDAWGFYSTNLPKGTNKGERIVISQTDFSRQYHEKIFSVVIIYDRRWSFPFDGVIKNYIPLGHKENSRIVLSSTDVENCYKKECNEVHFPITCNKQAHNGLHITNGKGADVYSIGSGVLIAAKLCLKDNENIPNGSNCFVLIKNQVRVPETEELKTFFVLYEHILPIAGNDLEQTDFRVIKELIYERDYIYVQNPNTKRKKNILSKYHDVCIQKLEKLKKGETVIFNDITGLIFEVAEHDKIGRVGAKGFSEKDVRDCIHWEIFSSDNIFEKDAAYELIDLSKVNRFDCDAVIEKLKDVMFSDFSDEKEYKKYCKHLSKNEITDKGIEKFYKTRFRDSTLNIILKNKSEWDSNRNFLDEYDDNNRKGHIKIYNLEKFNKENIQPFLWWNDEINSAMNKDLETPFTGKIAFYYNPIKFLYWLMSVDDKYYKKICPKAYAKEFEELTK